MAAIDQQGTNNGTYAGSPAGLQSTGLLVHDPDKAVHFDGTDDRININHSASLSPTAQIAISFIMNLDALLSSGASKMIFTKASSAFDLFLFGSDTNDTRLYFKPKIAGTIREVKTPSIALKAGYSYHVVCFYDGAKIGIYLDGRISVLTTGITGTLDTNTSDACIGADYGTNGFDGVLDEVVFYSTAPTAAQVEELYWAAQPPLVDPDQIGGVSEAQQAEYLTRAFDYCLQYDYIEVACWYQLRNNPTVDHPDDDTGQSRFGLQTTGFVKKPSWDALREQGLDDAVEASPQKVGMII